MLTDLDPFDIFDTEAARLDRHFGTLDEAGWDLPSRCPGWSVRDVLAHLAGEELYNHACLDGDLDGFRDLLAREGVGGGYEGFNEWCVARRRDLPVERVLREWRTENAETRERMRGLGRDAMIETSVGPYPNGLQAFHYASEYATHADDVGVPVSDEERGRRTWWRTRVGMFALAEQGSKAQVEPTAERISVYAFGERADLSPAGFVAATVGRLPDDDPLDRRLRSALRCLA
ncbi:hypothetical protein Misp01_75340 [Microtetraspora sp. NBRC 13810]|uniref:maleylpyruvate isomerase family mycothiol-dependent enzyme n=1 Tax=Microtetraspora sp. NBRC 13810 TaxID=3030990 RepID=UPI0024A5E63C|nr:maleylpyruvate isomerase family mycothiol-dependent enzyme [Microtetraspora sp. NBRC 13810]GLW12406.1 hypothetical protein Misp01_75340 [Microtetraspora sp. NBRC 13810]